MRSPRTHPLWFGDWTSVSATRPASCSWSPGTWNSKPACYCGSVLIRFAGACRELANGLAPKPGRNFIVTREPIGPLGTTPFGRMYSLFAFTCDGAFPIPCARWNGTAPHSFKVEALLVSTGSPRCPQGMGPARGYKYSSDFAPGPGTNGYFG